MSKTTSIDLFRGEHYFLSNFYPAPTTLGGIDYPTAEHAFQAQKEVGDEFKLQVARAATPKEAKALGRQADLRADWDDIKERVMIAVVHRKFGQNPDLAAKLFATDDALLVEGNSWHDQSWGSCNCSVHIGIPGNNLLGKALMDARAALR